MLLWLSMVLAAGAHQPHDPVGGSGLGEGGVALVLRSPAQNWRATEVARSEDGGLTWVSAMQGLDNVAEITDLRVSPAFAADGTAIVTTQGDGVYVTTDGGRTFSPLMADAVLDLGAIAHDGDGPVLLVHEVFGPVWRSADGGQSFTMAIFPPIADHLEAHGDEVAVAAGAMVMRSVDAGISWIPVAVDEPVLDLAVGEGVLALGTPSGLWLSEDGAPFVRSPAFDEPVTTVGISPGFTSDQTVLASTLLVGAWVSRDGGETFDLRDTGLAISDQTYVHYFAYRFSPDGRVFANTFEGLFVSDDLGEAWFESDVRHPGMITAIALSPDYETDATLLLGSLDSGVRLSLDRGETFVADNTGVTKAAVYDIELTLGPEEVVAIGAVRSEMLHATPPWGQWNAGPFAPDYPTRVAASPTYATNGTAVAGHRTAGLFRTTDYGESWVAVSGPMRAISAIAFGADGSTVIAGTIDGRLLRSEDGGASFTAVETLALVDEPVFVAAGPEGFALGTGTGLYLTEDGRQLSLAADLTGVVHQVAVASDGTVFAAMRGEKLYAGPWLGPYAAVGQDLTVFGAPHELAISPAFERDGTVFAAIDDRLFRSTDRGTTFAAIGPAILRIEEDAQRIRSHQLDIRFDAEASVVAEAVVAVGGWIEVPFFGVGIDWIGELAPGNGRAEVWLDTLHVDDVETNGSSGQQVVVHAIRGLASGNHVMRVVASGGGPLVVDAFDVYTTDIYTTDPTPTTAPPDLPRMPPAPKGCGCAASPGAAGSEAHSGSPVTPFAPVEMGERSARPGGTLGAAPWLLLCLVLAWRRMGQRQHGGIW